MQILSVTLKDFKTHHDRHFTFSPGTNAICGENGAGKTSILEAIAWVLFNYQGGYAKDDLIRNGSGSAEVTVEFISNRDYRTYTVQRHTNKGYTLYDPQLNTRLPYTRIKDEVLPWLRDHLGVAPGTDLGELFARTVGVPQGTFTADFLQPPESRKAVFDKILRVEEYKVVHRDLASLRRYAEAQVEAVERDLASYEERLTAWDGLRDRHQTLEAALHQTQSELAAIATQLTELEAVQQAVKAQAEQIQQLQGQLQPAQSQLEGQQQTVAMLLQSQERTLQAVQICTKTRPAYDGYQAAEAALQALTQQQSQQQALRRRQQQLQKTLDNRTTDLTRLQLQLDTMAAAAAEIAQLAPDIAEQTRLEGDRQGLQQRQTTLAQAQGELQATAQQAEQLARQISQATKEVDRLQGLAASVAQLPTLEQRRDRLQQQLSRLEAARQFEAELQTLVTQGQDRCDRHQSQNASALVALKELQQGMPSLATDAIVTIKAALEASTDVNQATLGQIQRILDDLTTQTDAAALQGQLAETRRQLSEVAKQQAALATLPERQQRLAQQKSQQTMLLARQDSLQQQLAESDTLQRQLADIETALATLADPRSRSALLQKSRQQQPVLQKRHDEMQAAQAGIQRQIADLDGQLQVFQSLDTDIAAQTQLKQSHQSGYLQYLQHERAAQEEAQIVQALETAQQILAQLQIQRDRLQADLTAALANFDPQQAEQIQAQYQALRTQRDRLSGGLPQQQQLLAELQRQLDDLQAIAQQRDAALVERKQRDRIKRFINFARKAYKEAGPRITERYVQQVAREADRLFRDLINRQNVALTWTRDYEIQVQEGPNTRRFVNLSGGEQMCAALAVRLALLKVLADIDIAFFDEPTTNMDRPRRESLAEAISRIKTFSQLFVISHDDTFEQVTENVIFVEREA